MSVHSLVETWLSQGSLAAGGSRSLDENGFWSVSYGSITLTLAVPEGEPFFVLYAPLMSVSGAGEQVLARFYRQLLIWQLEGNLPPGMAFGMDYDGTPVSVVGRYHTRGLDAAAFDTLLRETAAGAEELRSRLEDLFTDLAEEDTEAPTPDIPTGTTPDAQADTIRRESALSDNDLLRARLQGIRF